MSHFHSQAKLYAEYRPDYPAELFEFIAESVAGRRLAWDARTPSIADSWRRKLTGQ